MTARFRCLTFVAFAVALTASVRAADAPVGVPLAEADLDFARLHAPEVRTYRIVVRNEEIDETMEVGRLDLKTIVKDDHVVFEDTWRMNVNGRKIVRPTKIVSAKKPHLPMRTYQMTVPRPNQKPIEVTGTVADDKLRLKMQDQHREQAFPSDTLTQSAFYRVVQGLPRVAGRRWRFDHWAESLEITRVVSDPSPMVIRCEPAEVVDVEGESVRADRYRLEGPYTLDAWVDQDGVLVKIRVTTPKPQTLTLSLLPEAEQ